MQTQDQTRNPDKIAWRINEWCAAVGVGRSHTYDLLKRGCIKAVKSGDRTLIVTPPAEYIGSLPAA